MLLRPGQTTSGTALADFMQVESTQPKCKGYNSKQEGLKSRTPASSPTLSFVALLAKSEPRLARSHGDGQATGEHATLTTAPHRHRQPMVEAGKSVISRPPQCVTTKASRRAPSRYIRVLAGWLKFCPQPVGF